MSDLNSVEIEGIIEAVLFASGEAIDAKRLAVAAGCEEEDVHNAIASMSQKYETCRRGITIKKIESGYQLSTNKIYTENIRRCLDLGKSRPLSQTLLETLAIISYMQPVTKQQIADIRGADANHAINRLMEKGLVCEMGRHDAPGRPLLFGTTEDFLRKFGFSSIDEMPVTIRRIEEGLADSEADEEEGDADNEEAGFWQTGGS